MSSASNCWSRRSRTRSTGHGQRGAERFAQPDPDARAARGRREVPVHRAVRRRPPGRGKGRAKERVYSFRDEFGQWDPKNQRPELWNLYNGRIHLGESIRVFPLSNWTELDVWQYIAREGIEVPSIYYAHERDVFVRDGMLFAANEFCRPREDEPVFAEKVRYRTVGDASLTAVASDADTIDKIIDEVAATRLTERGATRGDDRVSEAAMEDRKREGYF